MYKLLTADFFPAISRRRAPWLGARSFPRASKALAEIKTAGRQGTRRGGALRKSLILRRNLIFNYHKI